MKNGRAENSATRFLIGVKRMAQRPRCEPADGQAAGEEGAQRFNNHEHDHGPRAAIEA